MVQRRSFLIGLASLFAAPAIVRIENIMPVRALVVDDPLTMGIRYQSWPFGATRPDQFFQGSVSPQDDQMRPLSYWLKAIERHRLFNPDLFWEPMPDWRVLGRTMTAQTGPQARPSREPAY